MLRSCRWPLAAVGREYALAVAADATGSSRPLPVTRRLGLTCAKPSFAIYGKLPINTKREDLIYPRDVLHHRGTWNSGERHAQADNECR